MRATEFANPTKINSEFVVNNPISDPLVVDALYNDPWYGLYNPDNYAHWNVLLDNDNSTVAVNLRLAWKSELRTYFGLNFEQVDEMEVNWNNYYANQAAIIYVLPPVLPTY